MGASEDDSSFRDSQTVLSKETVENKKHPEPLCLSHSLVFLDHSGRSQLRVLINVVLVFFCAGVLAAQVNCCGE